MRNNETNPLPNKAKQSYVQRTRVRIAATFGVISLVFRSRLFRTGSKVLRRYLDAEDREKNLSSAPDDIDS